MKTCGYRVRPDMGNREREDPMGNNAWPKPGERWHSTLGRPDIIIDEIDRNRFWVRRIRQFEPGEALFGSPHSRMHHLWERISDSRSKLDHRDINSFLNRYEKLEVKSRNRVTHEISTATAMAYLEFEPKSSRLSCLSVRIETPDFPDCVMEFHEINPGDPIEFLAGLDRKKVLNGLFGVGAGIPDFPATVASLESLRSGDKLRAKINELMQEFNGEHEQACETLVDLLRNHGLRQRDPDHMIRTRENPAATLFMDQVWTPIRSHLQMEIDTGMPSPFMPGLEDEGDVPGHG